MLSGAQTTRQIVVQRIYAQNSFVMYARVTGHPNLVVWWTILISSDNWTAVGILHIQTIPPGNSNHGVRLATVQAFFPKMSKKTLHRKPMHKYFTDWYTNTIGFLGYIYICLFIMLFLFQSFIRYFTVICYNRSIISFPIL